jgi:hypothetical protein
MSHAEWTFPILDEMPDLRKVIQENLERINADFALIEKMDEVLLFPRTQTIMPQPVRVYFQRSAPDEPFGLVNIEHILPGFGSSDPILEAESIEFSDSTSD